MLTKYKDVRLKKGVKSPLKNVFMPAPISIFFFKEKAPNFDIFLSVVVSGRIILSILRIKRL